MLSDWEAFCLQLKFPLSPQRAKGMALNVEARRAAGFDPQFIAELNVYAQSKGRTPAVFVFNPFAEGHVALGRALLAKENPTRAATELEIAVKLAPGSPDARFSLASAYSRLGRKEDAARELAEFKRLERLGK